MFLFVFIAIDKSDEWQLLKFILEFKGSMFLSIGVFKSVIGYIMFYSCSTLNDFNSDEDAMRCRN